MPACFGLHGHDIAFPFGALWDRLRRMRSWIALPALVAAALALGHAIANAEPPKVREIRRDPEGRRGISPYMELIVKGQAAFVGHDPVGAAAAFEEAIKLDPEKALGYFYLSQVQVDGGKLEEADKSLSLALAKHGPDDIHAKVLFNIATLRERQRQWQPAKEAWNAYLAFCQGSSHPRCFPGSATERIRQIDRRVQLEADYGKVRERIAKRIAEKEAEAAENAKKDRFNR
jgi:tetratricopeptide (TPR) repeat protein